jgi:predicted ABC-type ATPase
VTDRTIPRVSITGSVIDDHGGWAYTTFLADAGETFWPAFDGETPEESADWGWFTPEEMKALPLHPGFKLMLSKILAAENDNATSKSFDVNEMRRDVAQADQERAHQLTQAREDRQDAHERDITDATDEMLDEFSPDITKVGPHGYIHGWIKVDPGDVSLIEGRVRAPGYDCSLTRHTSNGQLDPERERLHRQIISKILNNHQSHQHPVATFFGGGTASGKSTALKIPDGDVHVDADEIKAQLPEYQQMLKDHDPRAAAFVHDESKLIATRAYNDALNNQLNVTYDSTGGGRYGTIQSRLNRARNAGYRIDAKYATVDTDEAVRREHARAAVTGRYVPEDVVRSTHSVVTNTFRRALDDNLFDSAELWDTNDAKPKLVGSKVPGSDWQVHNQDAWRAFSNKSEWWQS